MRRRNIKISKKQKLEFIKNLLKIGYSKNSDISEVKYLKLITRAFQLRFRQELINSEIDLECLLISENLVRF